MENDSWLNSFPISCFVKIENLRKWMGNKEKEIGHATNGNYILHLSIQ